jgi:hypothetical protein
MKGCNPRWSAPWHEGHGEGIRTVSSPYTKAVLSVIRLVAAGFIFVSLALYLPDLFLWLSHHPAHHAFILVLKAVPLVIGVVLYWKSDAIAEQLTKDLD